MAFAFMPLLLISQTVVFENTNSSLLNLNPSYAGSNGAQRVQTNARYQWPNTKYYAATYNIAFDAKLTKTKGGFGVNVYSDNFANGLIFDERVGLVYAQHVTIKKQVRFIPSIECMYIRRRVDFSRVTIGESMDGRLGVPFPSTTITLDPRVQNVSIGTGVLFIFKDRIEAGVSVKHLNTPELGLFGKKSLPAYYSTHFSYTMPVHPWLNVQIFGMGFIENSFKGGQLRLSGILYRVEFGVALLSGNVTNFILGYRNDRVAVNAGYAYYYKRTAGSNTPVYNIALAVSMKKKSKSYTNHIFENW